MKLYVAPGPNSYRVRIFMAEKDIELPLVELDYAKREHKSPQFLKLNSLGQVPVLELDDGAVITESVAICRYLEALHPTPALFGSDAVSKGKIEMWNRRMEQEVFATIGNVVMHTNEFFKERVTQVKAFAEAQKCAIPGKWAMISLSPILAAWSPCGCRRSSASRFRQILPISLAGTSACASARAGMPKLRSDEPPRDGG